MMKGSFAHVPYGAIAEAAELTSLRRFASTAAQLFDLRQADLGDRSALARGQGMDYTESRQYCARDDLRRMDWPVTARTGKPHTKVFHVEHGRETIAIVDLRASMRFGTRGAFKSVVAAHLATLAGWAADLRGDRFGVVTLGETVSSSAPGSANRTLPHGVAQLEQMTRARPPERPEPTLGDAIEVALLRGSPGATSLLFSDLHDDLQPLEMALHTLAACRTQPVLLRFTGRGRNLAALSSNGTTIFLEPD
jgi:uncharacterized protein (DUF58 family)